MATYETCWILILIWKHSIWQGLLLLLVNKMLVWFLACLFRRKSQAIVIARVLLSSCLKCSPLLKKHKRYQHQTWNTWSSWQDAVANKWYYIIWKNFICRGLFLACLFWRRCQAIVIARSSSLLSSSLLSWCKNFNVALYWKSN